MFQPKTVKVVESLPQFARGSSLSMPKGSKWCDGRATYWVVGQDGPQPNTVAEEPLCQNVDGTWTYDSNVAGLAALFPPQLDPSQSPINRKDCAYLNVNKNSDDLEDIVCVVGYGFNELYLTQSNGNVVKQLDHGLELESQDSMWIETLKGHDGSVLVLVASTGKVVSGKDNRHRMFRVNPSGAPWYFEEVTGPFKANFDVTNRPIVADINNDGTDDVILYSSTSPARMFVQSPSNGAWSQVSLPDFKGAQYWVSGRVDYLTSTSVRDLVVTTSYNDVAYVHLFRGTASPPYFDFRRPFHSVRLDSVGVDLEILDVNEDGNNDVYVVMQQPEGCSSNSGQLPPLNRERDVLLIGTGYTYQQVVASNYEKSPFLKIKMDHKGRGCGYVRGF